MVRLTPWTGVEHELKVKGKRNISNPEIVSGSHRLQLFL